MILFQKSSDLRQHIQEQKAKNRRVGFVPTMGALHNGHLSLIQEAKAHCDLVVCSIFVNPTQFTQASDLETYPRPIENDIRLLSQKGCDVLFHPTVNELYADDMHKDSSADYGPFIHVLEGASRPGHFDGVITIVGKFFRLIAPHATYFGQKDYQQCLVVQTLLQRQFPEIEFVRCPIAREPDGLAMSSRNIRLSASERELAPVIYETLREIKAGWNETQWRTVLDAAQQKLSKAPLNLEYIQACHPQTLLSLDRFEPNAVILVAVQLGSTRLIDNILLPE